MSKYEKKFDVIVVGAGHAGCEASLACAKMGLETLTLCLNLDTVAAMSCNPAIGGLAKGHLVREIDALGGIMGLAADATGIQFKMLNTKRGPAVQAPRAQCDKFAYRAWVKQLMENTPRLTLKQGQVDSLLIDSESKTAYGVRTRTGIEFEAKAVIVTTGTFLKGLIHIGEERIESGRAGEHASYGLSGSLTAQGFELGRLKTGTNPRVDAKTLDFSVMSEAPGDTKPRPFSYRTQKKLYNDALCWTVNTNEAVHDAITASLAVSPLYNGQITGIGPRYCPSIETKVVSFPDRKSHQVFVEPEGLNTNELYLNGLSTSLPEDHQLRFLREIPGFSRVEIMRPGYAVEYDFVPPTQIRPTLETKKIQNLYLAGQINGTSGYEEAAAQGLMAGINAARRIQGKGEVVLDRSQAYIGVLIDDLVTKGTAEPYRLFTSLAEYRLLLRADNADLRLMDLGLELGLLDESTWKLFDLRRHAIEKELTRLRTQRIKPTEENNATLAELGTASTKKDQSIELASLLQRPEMTYEKLSIVDIHRPEDLDPAVVEQVEIQIKYHGYIQRQEEEVRLFRKLESKQLPEDFDYMNLNGLKNQAKETLVKFRPVSIGQASRLPGVTPADISVLLVFLDALKKHQTKSIS